MPLPSAWQRYGVADSLLTAWQRYRNLRAMDRTIVLKSRGMQLVEHRLGRPLDEVLTELYIDQGMTVKQVAAEIGVSTASVSRWMSELGIQARYIGTKKVAV